MVFRADLAVGLFPDAVKFFKASLRFFSVQFARVLLASRQKLSNPKTRILLLTLFVGVCSPGRGQVSKAPLPESIPITPEVVLSPPGNTEQPGTSGGGEPRSLSFPVTEPPPIIILPVQPVAPAAADLPKWRFHFRLDTSVTYDDNIFIQPSQRQSDVYFGVTPYLAAGWGTFQAEPGNITGVPSRFPQIAERDAAGNAFFFRYAPTAVFFADHTDQNSFNEDVLVSGRWSSGKLTLEAEGRFQTLSAPNIDVGTRINNEVASGLLNVNYQVAQKTSLDSRFAIERNSYQGGLNSLDTSVSSILNYQALPKTTVGLGGSFGYTTVESGQDQYYEQGLLHLRYLPTYKITLDLTGGVEVRQIQNGPDHITPVFNFDISYAAHESTTMSLKVSRQTATSALFQDQDIQGTTIEASVRQLIFQKLYITVSGGYQHSDYVNAGVAANRTDDYFYGGIESAVEITKWFSVKAGYRFQKDDSSVAEFGFRRNIADLQFSLRF